MEAGGGGDPRYWESGQQCPSRSAARERPNGGQTQNCRLQPAGEMARENRHGQVGNDAGRNWFGGGGRQGYFTGGRLLDRWSNWMNDRIAD